MLIGFFLNPSETQLYADDTLLFFNGSSIREIESYLSADLRNIISWRDSNYLFLNYSKTKVILVGKHQRLSRVAIFSVSAFDKTFKIGSTSSSISVSCSIQASLGVITSTILPPKYLPGWACCGKPAKSFLERPVSHTMTPWYFHCSIKAV